MKLRKIDIVEVSGQDHLVVTVDADDGNEVTFTGHGLLTWRLNLMDDGAVSINLVMTPRSAETSAPSSPPNAYKR